MWKYKLIGIALFLKSFVGKLDFEAKRLDVAHGKKYYAIEKLKEIHAPENSGLTYLDDKFYFIVDSGGEPEIYVMNKNLEKIDTLNISGVSNKDWEALTADELGNFYIGDIGNNQNNRNDLFIYNVTPTGKSVDTIKFSYLEQKEYPPKKKERNYDSEAMYWHNEQLHFFSKNRGEKIVLHYSIPDSSGSYQVRSIEEKKLNHMITGADISPDGKIVALLSYGKIYIFKVVGNKIFDTPILLIETTRFGQSEAIAFVNNSEMIVSNEAGSFFKVCLNLKKLENR